MSHIISCLLTLTINEMASLRREGQRHKLTKILFAGKIKSLSKNENETQENVKTSTVFKASHALMLEAVMRYTHLCLPTAAFGQLLLIVFIYPATCCVLGDTI